MSERCTGACCEAFVLSQPYDKIMADYKHWYATGENAEHSAQDLHLIAPMLRPVGVFSANPVTGEPHPGEPAEYFTCVHFNKDTRDCGIYEIRPDMCRDYPYGKKCTNPGCTWSKVNGDEPGDPEE